MSLADSVIVLDFETTGLSPDMGDRAIEIGAVRLEGGVPVERFQELMHPGRRVSDFIASYTGITNSMLATASPCEEVMGRFADFIGDSNLVAHNASFDKRFLDSELAKIKRRYSGVFSCSLLAARRIYPQAVNHKLGTLVQYAGIPSEGDFHRALFDAEMTAKVWVAMLSSLKERYLLDEISFELVQALNKKPKAAVHKYLLALAG